MEHLRKRGTMVSAVIFGGVVALFAFVTNRQWAFDSNAYGIGIVLKRLFFYVDYSLEYWIGKLCMYL